MSLRIYRQDNLILLFGGIKEEAMIFLPLAFLIGFIVGGLLVDARRKRRIEYLENEIRIKADALLFHREQHLKLFDEQDRLVAYLKNEIEIIDSKDACLYDYLRARRTVLQGLLLKLQGRI